MIEYDVCGKSTGNIDYFETNKVIEIYSLRNDYGDQELLYQAQDTVKYSVTM